MSDVAFKVAPGKAGNPPMGFAALDTASSDVTIEWASATSFRIVVTNLPPSGVASLSPGTAIALTGTAADPIVNLSISNDAGNTATTGSDGGLLVPPVDPASLISADTPNGLIVGNDGKLVATGGGTGTVRFTFTAAPATVEASISAPITIPYDWEIIGWRMFDGTGGTGVATIDWLLLNNLGDTGVSITASATPYLSGSHAESSVLTGWTTTGTAGQLLQAVLTGVTGFREITCELLLAKG